MKKQFFYIIAIAIAALVLFLFISQKSSPVPKEGDKAYITLIGTLENGSIVENHPMYYVTIDSENLPPGVLREILTMRTGQKREILLEPKDAYGAYDFTLLKKVDRVNTRARFEDYTIQEFPALTHEKPEKNKTLMIKDVPWPVKILNLTNDTVSIEHKPVFGSIYFDPLSTPWQLRVIGIDPDKIFFRYDPKVGAPVVYEGQRGAVKEVDNENIILDFNSPLAGRAIQYSIKLWNFTSS